MFKIPTEIELEDCVLIQSGFEILETGQTQVWYITVPYEIRNSYTELVELRKRKDANLPGKG